MPGATPSLIGIAPVINSTRTSSAESSATWTSGPGLFLTWEAKVGGAAIFGGVAPTGQIQFAIDAVNFGGAVALTTFGNQFAYALSNSTSALSVGNHTITATYLGDATYATSVATIGQLISAPQVLPYQPNSYGGAISNNIAQAAPTVILSLVGSGTKTVKLLRVWLQANATADTFLTILGNKYSTAHTAGSPFSVTKVPFDSGNTAATATLNLYNASNATTLGTLVGTVRSAGILLTQAPGVVTVTNAPDRLLWDFTDSNSQLITLRGANESFGISLNSAANVAGNLFNASVDWYEDNS